MYVCDVRGGMCTGLCVCVCVCVCVWGGGGGGGGDVRKMWKIMVML